MASLGKRGADWARKNELSIAYGWLGKAGLLCMCCSVNGDSINSSHQGMKHILLDILSLESNEVLIMEVLEVLFGVFMIISTIYVLVYVWNPFKSDTFWDK